MNSLMPSPVPAHLSFLRPTLSDVRRIAVRPLARAAALALALLAAPSLHAATYYWDNNDSTAGFGTAGGTWAAPTTNDATQGWSASSAGTDTLSGTTTTTTSDALNFGTSANQLDSGTITVSGNVSANTIAIVGSSSNITLSGGNIALNGGLTATNSANTTAITQTVSSNITLGAWQTWTVNNGGSVGTANLGVSGNVLGGANGLTKNGNGTLTLSGAANSWNGTTRVNTGTLTLSGSLVTTGLIQTGWSTGGSVLNITGNLTQNRAANVRNLVIAGGLNLNGTVNVSGSGILNGTGIFLGEDSGGHAFFNQTGGTVNNTGGVVFLGGQTSSLNVSGGTFNMGTQTLTMGASIGANSTVSVSGTGSITMGVLSVGFASRNVTAMTVNLGDGTVGGNLSITNISYGAGTGAGPSTINFNGGTLNVRSSLSMIAQAATVVKSGGAILAVNSGQTFTIGNNLTDGGGGGGLTKEGAGTLTLSGTNTYTGATTINAGTLTLNNGSAIADTVAVSVSSGAVLNLGASETIGSIAGAGNITLGSNTLTSGGDNSSTTFTGAISGTGGAIAKEGTGTLSVPMSSTYTGTTTVNGGILRIENLTTNGGSDLKETPGSVFNINNGSTLVLHSNAGGNNRVLSNNDTFTFDSNGGGTLEWSKGNFLMQGGNTHHFITAGGLQNIITTTNSGYLNGQSAGTANFTVADGSDAVDLLVSGSLQNILINKNGAGTMSITTSTSGSNAITIQEGTLDIGGSATLAGGTYNATLTNNGTFSYSSSAAQTISSAVDGTGALTKDGSGTLTLAGSNTYTGATLVSAGTLLVNGSLAAGSAVTVDSGATLGGSGTINGAAVVNGNLRPGNSPGVLTFGSSLTLSSSSAVTMELNGTARGTEYDGIDVGGALTYGGALTITVGSAFLGSTETFSLFTSGSQSGDFASVSLEGAYGTGSFANASGVWSLTDSSGNQWSFSQASGDLGFTAVPEPSTWALLVSSALALLVVSRRRLARKK